MHTWRESVCVGVLPKEECSTEVVKSFLLDSSGLLLTFGQLSGFFFHTWPTLAPSPTCVCNFFSKLDSSPETYVGALASHIMGWCPLLFDPQGAFLHLWNVSLAPRMWNIWCPDPLLKQGFSSVQSLSCVQLFVTPWISARQASLLLLWLLRWHRRQSLAIYSVCDVTSISEGNWEPIYRLSQEMQTGG